MAFYTNIFARGSKMHLTEIDDNGNKKRAVINYRPYLFVKAQAGTETPFQTLKGQPVTKLEFENAYEVKQFMERHADIQGYELYGMTDWAYPFLNDTYPGTVDYDSSKISRGSIDIEVNTETGYPDMLLADKEFTTITMSGGGYRHVFSLKPFKPHQDKIKFYYAKTEADMLRQFVQVWETLDLDVITGWNIEFFDIPYLIRRIRRVLGDDWAKRLSPWGVIEERNTKDSFGKDVVVYTITGRSVIDYLPLYKKFTFTTRDNYKLDTIAEVELGINKVDYSEYGNLAGLWQKNPQLYTEYNVQDVDIVDQLETKLKLIELLYAISYDVKANFIDCFATVKPWDVLIHNHLLSKGIVIPATKKYHSKEDYGGGYVKEPQVGKHEWVLSFDLNSLYPSLIRHYNISPEKYRGMCDFNIDEDSLLDIIPDGMSDFMIENNVSITPNRCMWSRDGQGFLAEMMAMKYDARKRYKNEMLKLKDDAETARKNGASDEEVAKIELSALIMDQKQIAAKTQLNAAYGSLANIHNRWYMLESAAAITSAGRLTIKWTEKQINIWFNRSLGTTGVDYVIYADTDSVYVKFDEIVKKRFPNGASNVEITDFLSDFAKKKVEPFLDSIYDQLSKRMNSFENQMKMKREAIASHSIFVSAKGYALSIMDNEGVRFAKPKLKVTGLEAVRSSTPAASRDALKKAIEILLTGTVDEYHNFVGEFEKEFMSLPLNLIATNTSVNGLGKYAHPTTIFEPGTPYHVKAALLYNEYLKVNKLDTKIEKIIDGDKAGLFPLVKGNPLRSDYVMVKGDIPPELDNIREYLDYWAQFEKGFLSPMGRITKILGFAPKRVDTLESMFVFDEE